MIKKLVLNPDLCTIATKINEIIDHLPQEKEPKYCPICKWCVLPETIFCPNCKEDLRRQPTKEVQEKGYGLFCAICKERIKPNLEHKCGIRLVPTKEVPDILNAIKEVMIQLYYEELHPINKNTTAEDLKNRKEKAIDEYLGRNQKLILYSILHAKVDKAMAHIAKAIQEISALYRKEK